MTDGRQADMRSYRDADADADHFLVIGKLKTGICYRR